MDIKEKILSLAKRTGSAVKGFFTKEEKAAKIAFRKLDLAEIFMALLPAAIFGCLIFGWYAVLNLAVSVILAVGLDFLWELVFKKKKAFDYTTIIFGLLTGLIVSSRLNILLVIFLNIITVALRKTVFKNDSMLVCAPLLLARAFLAFTFFKAFSVYAFPLLGGKEGMVPVDAMLQLSGYTYPAKYLFFGVHSGNIGETSVLLLLIGGIYLIIRKIINPIIPISFVITSCVLSLIFGENIALSLLGGGLFFAALFLTLDYSFVSTPRYKKILYGIVCGVFTFVLRLIFNVECAYFAVIIADCLFLCVNKRNIKRFLKFVKNPDWAKLLNKLKTAFSV